MKKLGIIAAVLTLGATLAYGYHPDPLAVVFGGTAADLSGTGGTSQVLKQTSSGGAVTVARLACADLSNGAGSCSTDTTSATNISSGTLSDGRLPTSMATKTFTGTTSFPSSSSIDGSGNATFGGTLSVTGDSAFGAAKIGSTNQKVSSNPTYTHPLTGSVGIESNIIGTDTTASNGTGVEGFVSLPNIGASNNKNWTNTYGLYGVDSEPVITAGATGTITGAVGVYSLMGNLASGATVTNAYDYVADAGAATGTITNYVGLAVAALNGTNKTEVLLGTLSPPSGTYGIYQSDANKNYFAGNVGIGSTAPTKILDVNGQSNFTGRINVTNDNPGVLISPVTGTNASYFQISNTGGSAVMGVENSSGNAIMTAGGSAYDLAMSPSTGHNFLIGYAGGTNVGLKVDNSGNVYIPQTTTGTNADFLCMAAGGQILRQTTSCTISQRKHKERIASIDHGLAEVLKLRPVEFNRKDDQGKKNPDINMTKKQLGFIAEEVEAVDPRLSVFEQDGKTPLSYRTEAIVALLLKAVQEQQAEIVQLQARVH